MALSNAKADDLATAFCTAEGIVDAAAIAHWKSLARLIYSHILADIVATLPASSVVTTGSAATQTGPAAPVAITVT